MYKNNRLSVWPLWSDWCSNLGHFLWQYTFNKKKINDFTSLLNSVIWAAVLLVLQCLKKSSQQSRLFSLWDLYKNYFYLGKVFIIWKCFSVHSFWYGEKHGSLTALILLSYLQNAEELLTGFNLLVSTMGAKYTLYRVHCKENSAGLRMSKPSLSLVSRMRSDKMT